SVCETDAPLILGTILFLSFIISSGMSYKPNPHQHLPGTSGNQGNIPSPSSMATIQSYKPILNDFGPPSLGFPQLIQDEIKALVQLQNAKSAHRLTLWSQ
ncbi:uncharacterized protein, partial [Garra rufa]|uniref:uncharacterized protein n=1 Tax=Garra rufa TaxID=137080 RepID=UPI003CCE5E60